MGFMNREWKASDLLYALLILGLPALGVLQYRLITQLSEREYDHTRAVLRISAGQILNTYAQTIYGLRQSVEPRLPVPLAEARRMFGKEELPALFGSAQRFIDTIYHRKLQSIVDTT